ncbi:MAG: hypothetical protein U0529_14480 [Thermoanaerobaculia bacterium]
MEREGETLVDVLRDALCYDLANADACEEVTCDVERVTLEGHVRERGDGQDSGRLDFESAIDAGRKGRLELSAELGLEKGAS